MTTVLMNADELALMSGFRCTLLSHTKYPNETIYSALHQDYSSEYVGDDHLDWDERAFGEVAVKRLMVNNRGHYGPLEHVSVCISLGYYPHSVVQQVTRHRLFSFDVQSFRYTGEQLSNLRRYHDGNIPDHILERLIYLRPCGIYVNRKGDRYNYDFETRRQDIEFVRASLDRYITNIENGMPLEQARGVLPFDYRQHFVMSGNLRSFMHLLDIRGLKDAQLEIRALARQIINTISRVSPEIMAWYQQHRYGKNKLAP